MADNLQLVQPSAVEVSNGSPLHLSPNNGLFKDSESQFQLLLLQILTQLRLQKECTSTLEVLQIEKSHWDSREEQLEDKLFDLKKEKRLLEGVVLDLQFENQQLRKGKCNVTDTCAEISQKRIIDLQKQLKKEKEKVSEWETQKSNQTNEYEEKLRTARRKLVQGQQELLQEKFQIQELEETEQSSSNFSCKKSTSPESLPLKGKVEDFFLFLEKNDFSVNMSLSKRNWQPIHIAAAYGDPIVIEVLLNNGVDIDTTDESGMTPLMFAAEHGNLHAVQLLLNRDATLSIKDKYGSTALHKAASEGHAAIVCVLLIKGDININVANDCNEFPLHVAIYNNHTETVEALLENNVPVDSLDKENQTPLHEAAANGNLKIVQLLVTHGANLSALNAAGKMALDLANDGNYLNVVQFLKKFHTDD